jgi:broad specificity phosphatase PhoE
VAIPLSQHGRKQVQRLANYIRNIGISALYTSDLRRALETAQLLVEKLGFEPIIDERLRERHIGGWQGLTRAEMESWYPNEYKLFLADPENFQVPGGESRGEIRRRMRAAFDNILKQNKGETVGVISHSTVINALLSEIIPDVKFGSVDVSNSSVTTIARNDDGQWLLVAVDDVTHLEGLESQKIQELEEAV